MGTSANLVKVGQPVRLNIQLSDGEESIPRVVKGIIRNTNGTFVQEVTLTHVGGGLFKDATFTMPEIDELTVQYSVYELDGLTTDDSYTRDLDTFVRSDKVVSGGSGGTTPSDDEFIIMYNEEPEHIIEVSDENS
jgi:hypothetical protein